MPALEALLGPGAKSLSANTVTRLKEIWAEELQIWQRRDLSGKEYVYLWADGVYFNIRLEGERQCILVVMGATVDGKKELVAIVDGVRESEQSWYEVLVDLKHRGLTVAPKLAVGDGALGFWKALRKVFPQTRHQRCWVHKKANILNKLPKSVQPSAKKDLDEINYSPTRATAEKAFDTFIEKYDAKYPAAVQCLKKDKEALLSFYDFPAVHWDHLRSTNPIESMFATVRLRHNRTKGSGTAKACLAMVFKLAQAAEKRWLRLRGYKLIKQVIEGVKFVDGVKSQAG